MKSKNDGKSKKGKKVLKVLLISGIIAIISPIPGYFLAEYIFNRHFERWGNRLIDLENRGLLSTEYGAGWQDVLMDKAMELEAQRILGASVVQAEGQVVDGVEVADYPSLAVVRLLNEVREYSNTILIVDRNDRHITNIKTNHHRARMDEFPHTLVTALIAAEDRHFRDNKFGFQFKSFVRAAVNAIMRSIKEGRQATPRGTSTITQQVAKLFMSRLDEAGQRQVSNTVGRKLRELRLAAALRKMYTPNEILEVYMNHAATSDHGLIGYKDIARGLFNSELHELTDAQSIYLARIVKWGRNVPSRIIAQCHIDMPRMGDALEWSREKREEVLAELELLTFERPRRIVGEHGPLVDLANEFWLHTLRRNGSSPAQAAQMDLINPNSLVRRKGNLTIKLTIDLPLQQTLEKLVDERGYGKDTVILSEVRIGSHGDNVTFARAPRDTVRHMRILTRTTDFAEPGHMFVTTLNAGDTVLENIRYSRVSGNEYRRSVFYYVLRPRLVDGQYFAYSIMCSQTGKLLAYHSRDRLGSRLISLLRNRTPNGSALAKPILHALNYDLGEFRAYSRWTDEFPITNNVAWSRQMLYQNDSAVGVVFDQSAVRGRGYTVRNFGRRIEGCQYVFDLLSTSNNILAVEQILRLNRQLFNDGEIANGAFPLVNFYYRIGALGRVRDDLRLRYATGVRALKEFYRIAGAPVDSVTQGGRPVAISDSMYSAALGTIEVSLYEQMHIFNALYNNVLIERPAERNSLVIESIELNGRPVSLNDTIRRYHPFADINNIRPTLLGMHKRLATRWEGLSHFDVIYTPDMSDPVYTSNLFDTDAFYIDSPLSNFAKSGTSDDILRPFNVDASSTQRTNYCMWNAVIRIDMAKLPGADRSAGSENRDITVASIGEGNRQYTGPRDGKSLHRFLTTGLLQAAGVRAQNGFFSQYDAYLKHVTPATENCRLAAAAPIQHDGDQYMQTIQQDTEYTSVYYDDRTQPSHREETAPTRQEQERATPVQAVAEEFEEDIGGW